MNDQLALGYVFGLGMVAVFNPCGFAMLPAWIAYFLTSDGEAEPDRGVLRALAIGSMLTAGFVVVFLTLGLVIQLASAAFIERLPWASIVIGVAMILLATSVFLGREVKVRLPFAPRAPRGRSLPAVFGFGVSYAFISLACTIPLFLATVTTSITGGNVGVGLLHFVAYAAGMGVILTALTVALALAQAPFIARLRLVMPHMRRVAAVLLGVAGAYVAYYGWYQIQVYSGDLDPGGPAKLGYDLSARMSELINGIGSIRIALLAVLAVGAGVLLSLLRRETRDPGSAGPIPDDDSDRSTYQWRAKSEGASEPSHTGLNRSKAPPSVRSGRRPQNGRKAPEATR